MAGRIPKVVVVGSCYVDMAVKCGQFPEPGETVEGSGFSCVVTGGGANRAMQAALCNCASHLISKVGDDLFGKMVLEKLQQQGVNSEFVYTANAISTGIIVTMVDSIGENSSCLSIGANRALSADEVGFAVVEQLISSADICLIHDDMPTEVIVTAIRTAKLYETKVILEKQMRTDGCDDLDWPEEFYSIDMLVPNFHDADPVVELGKGHLHELKFIGSELVAKGIECVVIKMGVRGSFLINRNESTQIDGFQMELINHAGFSDAFAGALAASYGAGDEPEQAVRFAAAAGALAGATLNAPETFPSKEEIIELLLEQSD